MRDFNDMKTIELFAGTKSFSKVAQEYGFETYTVDNDCRLEPDWCGDILDFKWKGGEIDILWASPPCTAFSVASIRHYWVEGKPKNEKTLYGISLLEETIKFISNHQPKYWYIENPRGMMRKIIDPIFNKYNIKNYKRNTVSYCQYGAEIMKPTDIWTNDFNWTPRPICKPGASCHQRAGRGAKTGLQGIYNPQWEKSRGNTATARGVIPPDLFVDIFSQFKNDIII